MNLDQFIAKYNGKYVGDGQCGSLVRQYWIEVDQTDPPSYPDSKDYWSNPVPGYDKVSTPQPGDIAIYDGHGVFTEGHSSIVVNGTEVFEQNADPDGSPAHLFNRANTYLLGYLHKQGGRMYTDDEINKMFEARDQRMDSDEANVGRLYVTVDGNGKKLDDDIDNVGRLYVTVDDINKRVAKLENPPKAT